MRHDMFAMICLHAWVFARCNADTGSRPFISQGGINPNSSTFNTLKLSVL